MSAEALAHNALDTVTVNSPSGALYRNRKPESRRLVFVATRENRKVGIA